MGKARAHVRAGLVDLCEGLSAWRIWHLIGSAVVRRRYARSRLGQTWLTLSTAIFIALYGLVFSLLFRAPLQDILPYIAVSFTFWSLISGVINGATTCFTSNGAYFRNQYASFSIAVFCTIYQNLITFAHELIIVALILAYFGKFGGIHILSFLFSLAVLLFTFVWLVYMIGILCARFRDLIQLINSIMRAAFLLTPIIWKIEMVPEEYHVWLLLNPFAIFLSLVRDPILGLPLRPDFVGVALAATAVGFMFSLWFVGKYHRRIIFWV